MLQSPSLRMRVAVKKTAAATTAATPSGTRPRLRNSMAGLPHGRLKV